MDGSLKRLFAAITCPHYYWHVRIALSLMGHTILGEGRYAEHLGRGSTTQSRSWMCRSSAGNGFGGQMGL